MSIPKRVTEGRAPPWEGGDELLLGTGWGFENRNVPKVSLYNRQKKDKEWSPFLLLAFGATLPGGCSLSYTERSLPQGWAQFCPPNYAETNACEVKYACLAADWLHGWDPPMSSFPKFSLSPVKLHQTSSPKRYAFFFRPETQKQRIPCCPWSYFKV